MVHNIDSKSCYVVYATVQGEEPGACARRITGVELDSLITSVHDLLPDLGQGFIEVIVIHCMDNNKGT